MGGRPSRCLLHRIQYPLCPCAGLRNAYLHLRHWAALHSSGARRPGMGGIPVSVGNVWDSVGEYGECVGKCAVVHSGGAHTPRDGLPVSVGTCVGNTGSVSCIFCCLLLWTLSLPSWPLTSLFRLCPDTLSALHQSSTQCIAHTFSHHKKLQLQWPSLLRLALVLLMAHASLAFATPFLPLPHTFHTAGSVSCSGPVCWASLS